MHIEIHIDDRLLRPFAWVFRSRWRGAALAVVLLSGGAAVWAAPGDDISPQFTAGSPLTAAGLNGAFGQVTDQIATLASDVGALVGDLDTAEAALTALQTDVETAESGIAALGADLDAAEASLGTLSGDVTTLGAVVDTLEGEVAKDTGKVGDIVASFLTQNAFQAERGSTWVLCDGRNVGGSRFETLTGLTNLPDLRGMFLRGKNNGRSDGLQDTEGERNVGGLQHDSFRTHAHTINHDHGAHDTSVESGHQHPFAVGFAGVGSGGPVGALVPIDPGVSLHWMSTNVDESGGHTHNVNLPNFQGTSGSSGGDETAPRNIAVNYFCKIDD